MRPSSNREFENHFRVFPSAVRVDAIRIVFRDSAESFIPCRVLRTARAGRSVEDRLLCKQEALGSNPSRSTPLEVQPRFRPARIQFRPWSNFRLPFGLAPMRCRRQSGSRGAPPIFVPSTRNYRVPLPKTQIQPSLWGVTMPMIDVYAPADLFPAGTEGLLGKELTMAVLRAEGVATPGPFHLNNTAAFIHRMDPRAVHTAATNSARTVRVQVITPPAALTREG